MALLRSTDPLVWIDCEMTGLDPNHDTIMSIACYLTTSDLLPIEPQGFTAVICHTHQQLSQMSDWCVRVHGASGLTHECLASTISAETAAAQLLAYVKRFIPEPRRALLAGNSIHADRAFLARPPWSELLAHLHYRLFDVSSTKEMIRRWAGDEVLRAVPTKQLRHTAREDILESLEEARYYKHLIEGIVVNLNSSYQRQANPVTAVCPPSPYTTVAGNGSVDAQRFVSVPAEAAISSNAAVIPPETPTRPSDVVHSAGPIVDDNSAAPRAANTHDPNTVAPHHPVILGTKQGQEVLEMLHNNGTKEGDVGGGDQGFRTDVP